MSTLLMPRATAVWLIENSTLTFDQIATLCGLHLLEIKGIADGDLASSIRGQSPVTSGQITQQEMDKAIEDPNYIPSIVQKSVRKRPLVDNRRRRRYTPLSRRQDRPNAIIWLLRRHSNLNDSQIVRLAGTTRPTIASIRERTHWNYANLKEVDPVVLGLCLQSELDAAIAAADKRAAQVEESIEKIKQVDDEQVVELVTDEA